MMLRLFVALIVVSAVSWVAAFNGRPRDRSGFRRELDRGLWEAKNKVKSWPEGDLFSAQ